MPDTFRKPTRMPPGSADGAGNSSASHRRSFLLYELSCILAARSLYVKGLQPIPQKPMTTIRHLGPNPGP